MFAKVGQIMLECINSFRVEFQFELSIECGQLGTSTERDECDFDVALWQNYKKLAKLIWQVL